MQSIPTLAPSTPAELAEILADASQQQHMLVPWGSGRHQHLGRAPVEGAQPLYTGNLAQVIEYVPADLTI
ncbi:MAG TPA: hypothetical protein VFT99_20000, partial [Roseiflexaceae bacterium]|nr:hypothetical protein [Roseiflexaceae bacterium]